MGAHRRAGRRDRTLVLRAVPPQMQRLLVATRLHRILCVEGGISVDGGGPEDHAREDGNGLRADHVSPLPLVDGRATV
ncbi:hypothetical protein GCM10012280_43580 [Wenjunlia tyrosinilytica]|uniref:Uncharacterized protein n=2 Tax=Wenjunlia tyrosinilytica TaxID=1544741 RepID=A0A917ZSF0_9ACTN|nr:hypothetical protein GCM10012280_43580 [Wenjunlia tyrosinilytica]